MLSVIPTDHLWQPSASAAASAEETVRNLDPHADAVVVEWHVRVMFVDCGGNWEGVRCPKCNQGIEDWFSEQATVATDETELRELGVVTPCCNTSTTLNDLKFSWPAGFASFAIRVETPSRAWDNPTAPWFTDAEVQMVEAALGTPVRQVLAHY